MDINQEGNSMNDATIESTAASVWEVVRGRADVAMEMAKAGALGLDVTPEYLRGMATNAEWLMRKCLIGIEFEDGAEDESEVNALEIDLSNTRRLVPSLAATAKALNDFAELIEGLNAFRDGKAA